MAEMSAPPNAAPSYPCSSCGARLQFAPGTTVLKCPYCGYEQQIADTGRQVSEHAYAELATLPRKPVAQIAVHVFQCQKCGARTESNLLSQACQFCGAPLVADMTGSGAIVPEAVLPFVVDRNGMRDEMRKWVKSRWFAPNSLKKVVETEQVAGTYLPHWTYDARTVSDYVGQRGEYYYTTETYTTEENGQTVTKTRQVRHTRWYPAAGQTRRDFDDVLVPATTHVAPDRLAKLEPWVLSRAVPYQPDFLAGYQALRYDSEPEAGLEAAKQEMAPVIREDCRQDIGGDEQQVHSVNTSYFDLMYKLVLLPVWIAAYLHAGRSYQITVNASTGEVVGERPYSAAKIALAVVAAIVLITAIIVVYVASKR
jgi:DNA-directed RNA polymerase subunit RPC12/RpoP